MIWVKVDEQDGFISYTSWERLMDAGLVLGDLIAHGGKVTRDQLGLLREVLVPRDYNVIVLGVDDGLV